MRYLTVVALAVLTLSACAPDNQECGTVDLKGSFVKGPLEITIDCPGDFVNAPGNTFDAEGTVTPGLAAAPAPPRSVHS